MIPFGCHNLFSIGQTSTMLYEKFLKDFVVTKLLRRRFWFACLAFNYIISLVSYKINQSRSLSCDSDEVGIVHYRWLSLIFKL